MNAELWILVLKTGGTLGAILAAVGWLFRRGGRISLRFGVDFGGPGRNPREKAPAGDEKA